jgi:hypothetical protein
MKRDLTLFEGYLFAVLLYCSVALGLISLSRIEDMSMQMLPDRFFYVGSIYWLCLFCLSMHFFRHRMVECFLQAAIMVWLVCIVYLQASAGWNWIGSVSDWIIERGREEHAVFGSGIENQALLKEYGDDHEQVIMRLLPELKARGIGAYGTVEHQLLGKKIDSVFTPVPLASCNNGACSQTAEFFPDKTSPAWRIRGEVTNTCGGAFPDVIFLTTPKRVISGYGYVYKSQQRGPLRILIGMPPAITQKWEAFAPAPAGIHSLTAWVLARNGHEACSLGTVSLHE